MSFLRQLWLVTRREFLALLALPLYYVLCGIFFLLAALIYLLTLLEFASAAPGTTVNVTESVIRPTFDSLHFFLLFQVPLLTMRVFAEERASGMLDLLQTMPSRDWSLVGGKFLAMCLGLFVYIALTAAFPITTSFFGDVEWPVIAGSLMALVLASATYISIGLFFSSITESQVVAAVLSYVTIFMVVLSGYFADGFQIEVLQQAMRHLSVSEHVNALLIGNIAPMNVVYFFAVTTAFLFLTARILENRRGRA